MVGVKEYASQSHKFLCSAIAPNLKLVVTGDDNRMLNIWSFSQNTPVAVS